MIRYRNKVCIVILTMIMCMYISVFHYQFVLIQGESMYPTYHNLQLVIIKKNYGAVECGDVIAFKCTGQKNLVLIKRIIALPNDKVEIIDGEVYVNGIKSNKVYQDGILILPGDIEYPVYLSDNEYFVIGDNYEKSIDSRYASIGLVEYEDILGVIIPNMRINR